MTVPLFIHTKKPIESNQSKIINPLEDPLNYGALAEFSGFFEFIANVKTWMRNKKRTRRLTSDASVFVNKTDLKDVIQN